MRNLRRGRPKWLEMKSLRKSLSPTMSPADQENNIQRVKKRINAIIKAYKNNFNFEQYHTTNTFRELWEDMFLCLSLDHNKCIYKECLICIEILSQDKTHLNVILTENHVNTLLQFANLVDDTRILITTENTEIIIEGLKSLCNIVYISKTAQDVCCYNKTVDCIILRLRTYFEQDISNDIKYFDLKLLFLLTSFNKDLRIKIKEQLHGHIYLTEVLNKILHDSIDSENCQSYLEEDNVLLSCEVLKTLFNLTAIPINDSSTHEDNPIWIKLISILCDLLVTSIFVPSFQQTIIRNVVNLLTNAPTNSFNQLLIDHHSYDINALKVIIDFLDSQLSSVEDSTYEKISPSLIFLLRGSKSIAKFHRQVRYQILPPHKNVFNRIGQGNTLRDKLCRLLTAPDDYLRDLAAELLFILCKESVSRMIKYTGFNVTSGLFVNQGLFLKTPNPEYSSNSEDSDTEEYWTFKCRIKPVHNFELLDSNPFEHTSDKQQGNEVMPLVTKMDKLTREEYVHELQEERISDSSNVTNNDGSDDLSDPYDSTD